MVGCQFPEFPRGLGVLGLLAQMLAEQGLHLLAVLYGRSRLLGVLGLFFLGTPPGLTMSLRPILHFSQ